jgi:hypothetical protein
MSWGQHHPGIAVRSMASVVLAVVITVLMAMGMSVVVHVQLLLPIVVASSNPLGSSRPRTKTFQPSRSS